MIKALAGLCIFELLCCLGRCVHSSVATVWWLVINSKLVAEDGRFSIIRQIINERYTPITITKLK